MRVAERAEETAFLTGSPVNRAAAGARPWPQRSAASSPKFTPFPTEIVTNREFDKSITRTVYGDFCRRARLLAAALTNLGLRPGDRVASMMWNHSGHLEAFFGVPCAGGILHTLNLRLHPHEIAAIVRQADDRFLLIDDVLLPLFEKYCETVSHEHVIVVHYGCNTVPEGYLNYEE